MDIIKLSLDKGDLNLLIDHTVWIFLGTIALLMAILYFINKNTFAFWGRKNVGIDGAKIGLAGMEISIKPNYQTIQVAYKLWVELSTRKLGLLIDLEHDVIEEIYNSWYEFFKVTRELIKEIPAQEALNKDTRQLITVATDVLNKGVRPHLTKWQARFRKWCDIQRVSSENGGLSPQELQKRFNCAEDSFCYEKLTDDLLEVNKKLIEYKNLLEKIVFYEG